MVLCQFYDRTCLFLLRLPAVFVKIKFILTFRIRS